MKNSLPPRIDVHSHFLPPFYHDQLVASGNANPDGMPAIPTWSLEAHLDMMQAANVQKAILSISSPGTHLYPDNHTARQKLTRQCNAYAADLKEKYPDKFGFWASLPLPHVADALDEIHVSSESGCDGFALMTNYHGHYIGDARFDAVFSKLNDLGATVFIHPTAPCTGPHGTATDPMPTTPSKALPFGSEYPVPIFEFLFDTARAVINLFFTGTVDRCPNIKFVIPHLGGTLPPLISRFIAFGVLVPGTKALNAMQVRKQLLEQFYFDMAGAAFDGESGGRGQLKALVEGFDISYQQLLYGSDFPFTSIKAALTLANRMQDGLEHLFGDEEREAIYYENAARFLKKSRIKKPNL